MDHMVQQGVGPAIPSNARWHIVNCFGFTDPASREFSRHVGLHPGILLACYNDRDFRPLVQWVVSRIADAGIGDDGNNAPAHVVVFVCKSGTHRSVAMATLLATALPAWGPYHLCSGGWSTRCYGKGCVQCSRLKDAVHGQVLANATASIRAAFDRNLRDQNLWRQMHVEERRQLIDTSSVIVRARSTAAACQARIPGHSAGPVSVPRAHTVAPQPSKAAAPPAQRQPPLKPAPSKPKSQGVTLAQVQSGQIAQPARPASSQTPLASAMQQQQAKQPTPQRHITRWTAASPVGPTAAAPPQRSTTQAPPKQHAGSSAPRSATVGAQPTIAAAVTLAQRPIPK
eukprot:6466004-Amphidinium_carterae.1